jgi:DNA-binding beta-propeller fold protein YncE
MKTFFLIPGLVCVFLFSIPAISQQHHTEQAAITIEKNWESADLLTTSESVCYNAETKELYVSCINGNPLDKDGNGFISKLSLTGDIIILEWIAGLNAPKGMGIVNGFLYVTDIDMVVKISIAEEIVVKEFFVPGAKFLNDIAVDLAGNVYVSDMTTNEIHRIKHDEITPYYKNEELIGTNGLAFENGQLLIGTKNGIFSLQTDGLELKHLVKNTGGIDGLEPDGKGNYIISDWSGKVQVVSPDKEHVLLFDTTAESVNAADIVYIADRQLLLVPTFFNNRVVAYYLIYKRNF